MERFSNKIEELMKTAEIEIGNFDLKEAEKMIAYFSELPSISGFPYKIILVKNAEGKIYSKFRQWDTAYNLKHWTSGIYNLDRLRIITDENVLSETESDLLKEHLAKLEKIHLPESINEEKAIILDGSEWKFGVCLANKNIDYCWRAATEDIQLFVPIIDVLRAKYLDRI
ncbi:hypothetical protein QWT87_13555 [Chryseobacterium sp. APV1]|jgi:DNA mismatch repair ATPase MutL|uniref:Uncharacterized protein n=1 Tax=Chryseobacterium urinae TaxID=3058400 RepID=A0ABT8U4C1_9FLAO|nr:hypothetical protein [Chryseobacterium sp. APV1]MDO3425921.1 hypothetical protein [Chryseobacterium sp. APV1]